MCISLVTMVYHVVQLLHSSMFKTLVYVLYGTLILGLATGNECSHENDEVWNSKLLVSTFNIQVLGKSKMSKPDVTEVLYKVSGLSSYFQLTL